MSILTNRADLRTDIRSMLNESSEGFWLDSELNRWINESLVDISLSARRRAVHTFSTAVGTQYYTLPADLIPAGITLVYYDTNRRLGPTTLRELLNSGIDVSARGTPDLYYLSEDETQLGLWRVPDAAKTVVIDYFKFVAQFTDDLVATPVPEQYRRLIRWYVLHMAYQKGRRDLNASSGYFRMYQDGLADMAATLALNQSDAYPGTRQVLWPSRRAGQGPLNL